MKIYKFFIKSNEGIKLYAYTTNKGYRDIFIGLRDMNVFNYKKDHIDKNEYKKFRDKYKTCELFEPAECKIVCTGTEYGYIVDEARFKVNEDLACCALYDPEIFDIKYFRALNILQYPLVYSISSDDDAFLDEFLSPNIFHTFYISFKNTFKRGKK